MGQATGWASRCCFARLQSRGETSARAQKSACRRGSCSGVPWSTHVGKVKWPLRAVAAAAGRAVAVAAGGAVAVAAGGAVEHAARRAPRRLRYGGTRRRGARVIEADEPSRVRWSGFHQFTQRCWRVRKTRRKFFTAAFRSSCTRRAAAAGRPTPALPRAAARFHPVLLARNVQRGSARLVRAPRRLVREVLGNSTS